MNFDKDQIQFLLRQQFPKLSSDIQLMQEMVDVGVLARHQAGTVIIDFGEYPRIVPLVFKGVIKVLREGQNGGEILLYYLLPGETCTMSFSCCMEKRKSEISAIVQEEVIMLGIPIKSMDGWISKYPVWKHFILRSYDNRMTNIVQALDSIVFQKLDNRLLEYLKEKVRVTGTQAIETTHHQISLELNASREAVSRLLKKLENQGVVALSRNKIKLLKQEVKNGIDY